jgi:hypothetical protein
VGAITPDGGSLVLVKGKHLALYNINTRETRAFTDASDADVRLSLGRFPRFGWLGSRTTWRQLSGLTPRQANVVTGFGRIS